MSDSLPVVFDVFDASKLAKNAIYWPLLRRQLEGINLQCMKSASVGKSLLMPRQRVQVWCFQLPLRLPQCPKYLTLYHRQPSLSYINLHLWWNFDDGLDHNKILGKTFKATQNVFHEKTGGYAVWNENQLGPFIITNIAESQTWSSQFYVKNVPLVGEKNYRGCISQCVVVLIQTTLWCIIKRPLELTLCGITVRSQWLMSFIIMHEIIMFVPRYLIFGFRDTKAMKEHCVRMLHIIMNVQLHPFYTSVPQHEDVWMGSLAGQDDQFCSSYPTKVGICVLTWTT